MTSKVFLFLIPGVEVQDGISHQATKPQSGIKQSKCEPDRISAHIHDAVVRRMPIRGRMAFSFSNMEH
jgi:hypothetical protein